MWKLVILLPLILTGCVADGVGTPPYDDEVIVNRDSTVEERMTALENFVKDYVAADENSTQRPTLIINER